MSQMIKVAMADLKVCKYPDNLTTIGLGSCVGISMWDPSTKVTGLAHIMLPDSTHMKNVTNIAKFADTGIPELYKKMLEAGATRGKIVAKIAGGAKMFGLGGEHLAAINIGANNADASRMALKKLGVPVIADDTGANYGRTVEIYSENGDYVVKAVGKPRSVI